MGKFLALSLSGLAILVLLFPSCAPTPAPSTTRLATPSPLSTPASNIPPPASPDPWAKVIEAAKKEGKLTDYSYNFTGDVGIAIGQAFKERYGIQVEIITGRGAEFIERLKIERRMGSLVGDMSDNNAINAKIMKDIGLTVGIANELPVLRERDVWLADIFRVDPQDKHIIIFNFSIYSPWVNTNLVKPGEEPKVWKDFLDPMWKGKMTAMDIIASPGIYQWAIPLMREKVIDEDFLKALYAQDLKFVIGYPNEAPLIARGERSLAISSTDSVYNLFISQGAPLRAVSLGDGTPLGSTVVVAFNGGPHPNAAKVFINWLLSQEGQTIWGKARSLGSVRKDVTDSRPRAAQITIKRPIIITNEDSDAAAKLYQERWLNKLWGR